MPKKGRTRLGAEEVATRQQAEMVLAEHARLSIELEAMQNALSSELVEVADKYEGRLEKIKEALKSKTKLLNTWAKANPDEFVKGKKSVEFIYGRIGFRTTPPKVSRLAKAKEDFVLGLLRTLAPNYIRKVEEINKDAILADFSAAQKSEDATVGEKFRKKLAKLFLQVTSSETFFVEPKLEPANKEQAKQEVAT